MLWRQHIYEHLIFEISVRLKERKKDGAEEEFVAEDAAEECLFKVVERIGTR
jgi:hypothetical protein